MFEQNILHFKYSQTTKMNLVKLGQSASVVRSLSFVPFA